MEPKNTSSIEAFISRILNNIFKFMFIIAALILLFTPLQLWTVVAFISYILYEIDMKISAVCTLIIVGFFLFTSPGKDYRQCIGQENSNMISCTQ